MKDSFLTEHGIVPQKRDASHTYESIGFSEVEQKWYGWTGHSRAGFGIGDSIQKGFGGYTASTPEEMIDDYAESFSSVSEQIAEQYRAICSILPDRSGIMICPKPIFFPTASSFEELAAALTDDVELPILAIPSGCYIRLCGIGSRPAATLEDAYILARGFAEGAY